MNPTPNTTPQHNNQDLARVSNCLRLARPPRVLASHALSHGTLWKAMEQLPLVGLVVRWIPVSLKLLGSRWAGVNRYSS